MLDLNAPYISEFDNYVNWLCTQRFCHFAVCTLLSNKHGKLHNYTFTQLSYGINNPVQYGTVWNTWNATCDYTLPFNITESFHYSIQSATEIAQKRLFMSHELLNIFLSVLCGSSIQDSHYNASKHWLISPNPHDEATSHPMKQSP